MKKILLALLLFATPAFAGPLEPWQGGTGCETDSTYLVSQLPGSPNKGTICVISDGADETDCTVGGGTAENVCIYISGGSGVDYGWKQLDLDYTEVSDSFYVTKDTNGGLPEPSVIPSCINGTDGGVLGYNTSTHAFVCYDTTRLAVVSSSADVTTGLCYWSTSEGSIQCGNTTGVRTMLTKSVAATTYLALDGSNIMTGGITFEGATANAWETTLNVVDPTVIDKTINLPDASGTVAVSASGSLALSATGDVTLSDDGVTEAKLKAVDAPADEECLTYESTVGDFEWQVCGGGLDETAADLLYLRLDGANDPLTGDVYTTAGSSFVVGANEFTMTINGTTYDSTLASHVDDGSTASEIEAHRHENTTAAQGAVMYGSRSRGTEAAETVVQSGDHLLSIAAVGHDGTDYALSSRIDFEVDNTPGANDMPGAIDFRVSADGGQSPISRFRVDSAGVVWIQEDSTLRFEGATADANETTLSPVDPTGTNTINIPDASGTMAVSGSGAIAVSAAGNITVSNDGITEAMLKAVDAPADEECFTYESTTGDFEWQSCATSVGTGTFLKLDGTNDPVTSNVIFISNSGAGIDAVQDSSGSASTGGLHATNNVDAANVDAATFYGPNRATAANGDNVNITFELEDSAGSYVEIGSIRAIANDVTTTAMDGGLQIFGIVGGTQTEMARFVATTASQATVVINEGSNDIDFRVESNNDANAIFVSGAADSITFGSSSYLAKVGIDGIANEIQFNIQGNATQTVSMLNLETSAGTDVLSIDVNGNVTKYNSEATAGLGMPYQVANVALTAQAATIGATTLYSPTVDTTVMVKAYTIVTQTATTSSTLGSVGLVYTDADNATSQTVTMRCNNRTGSSVTSVTGNSLTTSLTCEGMYRVNGGTSMTYNMGYASSGATPMQYSLYIVAYAVQQ